jgi:hypothetical protein
MAANGAVVRLPVELAPTCAKAEPSAAMAIQIGIAVADACEALGVALAEGGTPMRPETRKLSGEKLAVVVELQLASIGTMPDFSGVAVVEGCRVLLERHAAGMYRVLGENVPEAAVAKTFNELCGHIIIAAKQVTAIELAYRSN